MNMVGRATQGQLCLIMNNLSLKIYKLTLRVLGSFYQEQPVLYHLYGKQYSTQPHFFPHLFPANIN